MSMQDPISDFIAAVNNASRVFHSHVRAPHSKIKENLCQILVEEGFVQSLKVLDLGNNKKQLELELKYTDENGAPTIAEFKRASKPSLRRYVATSELPVVYNGFGEAIISTSKGLMTAKKAKAQNLGGEFICTIF